MQYSSHDYQNETDPDIPGDLFARHGRHPTTIEQLRYTVDNMNYRVGSRIRFRLYAGREVEGVIRAIVKTTSGMRYRVEYGRGPFVATVSPEQIVHAERPDAPKDVKF